MIPQIIHDLNDIERHNRLIKELSLQGITEYEFWDAIYDRESVRKGINQAHKQIIDYAHLKRWDMVLVMENDVRFCGLGAFDHYIGNIPQDFDIYLGGIYLGEIGQNSITKRFSGLHCYIVHSRFYETFLSVPDDEHIDIAISELGVFKVSHPFTSIQYNGRSNNTKKYENYDHLLQNRILYNNFQL